MLFYAFLTQGKNKIPRFELLTEFLNFYFFNILLLIIVRYFDNRQQELIIVKAKIQETFDKNKVQLYRFYTEAVMDRTKKWIEKRLNF